MEPVAGKVAAAGAAALGNFVLVVREHQVHAAGMQVKGIAKIFVAHGRALQVPAGAAFTPGRWPEVRPVLRATGFPQHEVSHAVLLVLIRISAGVGRLAQVELLAVEMCQLAVVSIGRNAEIHGTVLALVSVPTVYKFLHDIQLLLDVTYGAGLHMRGKAVERLAVRMELGCPLGGVFAQRHTLSLRVTDGLVVHVGEVAHMLGTEATQFHNTAEHVLYNESAEITDMSSGIHSGAATVEAQLLAVFCLHWLYRPRLCIV